MKTKKLLTATVVASLIGTMSIPSMALADVSDVIYVGGKQAITLSPEEQQRFLPEEPAVKSAAVLDPEGREIYAYNAREISKIASVTKTMTAIIAASYPQDEIVRVSALAGSIPGSAAYIKEGDELALGELMEGLMLPSGNDAAYAIAEHIGSKLLESEGRDANISSEDKVARFVDEMNARAAQLGMADSYFANPCGLDDEGFEGDHHSTACDVAKMAYEAMKHPEITRVAGSAKEVMDVKRGEEKLSLPQENTNHLLDYNPDCRGVKTGFTDQAGNCLASAFELDGQLYTVAILGADNSQQSFDQAEKLWDWAKTTLSDYNLVGGWNTYADHPLLGELANTSWMDKTVHVGLEAVEIPYVSYDWDAMPSSHMEVTEVSGTVHKGDVVGKFRYEMSDGTLVAETNVIALDDLEEPDFWEGVKIWFLRLIAPLTGEQTVAQNHCSAGTAIRIGEHYHF